MPDCAAILRICLVAMMLLYGATAAAVDLRFAPADTAVATGTPGRLSIVLDDAVTVRTLDVKVTYDPTVVSAVGGDPGTLYTSSGFQLFEGYIDSMPGKWHGYVIIMGADDHVLGPGELFVWDFVGDVDGRSDIVAVEVNLSDDAGDWYTELSLPPTTVIVGDGPSAVAQPPLPRSAPHLVPNPFNPRTSVALDLPAAGPLRLEVFDARGRRVATLHDGPVPAGPFQTAWDGHGADGHAAPGGVYLFRCRFASGSVTTKGILLR